MLSLSPDAARPAVSQLRSDFARAFARETGVKSRWVAVACEAPTGLSCALVDRVLSDSCVYFAFGAQPGDHDQVSRPEAASAFVGMGAAVALHLSGPGRFEEAEARMRETYLALSAASSVLPLVRFFGGAAFEPGRDGAAPAWSGFGDAHFVLPQVIYVDAPMGAQLVCVAERSRLEETLALADKILGTIAAPASSVSTQAMTLGSDSAENGKWNALVESIKTSIEGKLVEKVVAARRLSLHLTQAPRLSEVLTRLQSSAPHSARFALRIGGNTFVGATPERLIVRQGLRVRTEALAGSIDSRAEHAAAELQASAKDRQEHAYVVDALRRVLSPLCAELHVPEVPQIRELKHLLHLCTPVEGLLHDELHILALVDQLHPTPAVGGIPKRAALEFIQTHEESARGWYAAPIGWVDSQGDGEFVVSLRSGLIAGQTVHLYAGAGIISASNADEELAETDLKFSGMLSALGLVQ